MGDVTRKEEGMLGMLDVLTVRDVFPRLVLWLMLCVLGTEVKLYEEGGCGVVSGSDNYGECRIPSRTRGRRLRKVLDQYQFTGQAGIDSLHEIELE